MPKRTYLKQSKFNITCKKVRQVELQDDRITIFVPFRPIGDVHFMITILYDTMMLGASFEEVKTKIQAPTKLKTSAVVEYIRYHGRKIYAQSDSYLSANGYEIIPI